MAKRSAQKSVKEGKHKSNDYLIAVVAILAIFIIVYIALHSAANKFVALSNTAVATASGSSNNVNNVGQASLVAETIRSCKFLAAPTTIYDSQSLSVTLEKGKSTYYQGNTVTVDDVTSTGCIISVGSSQDFLAVGQLQKLGTVYITVTDILQ